MWLKTCDFSLSLRSIISVVKVTNKTVCRLFFSPPTFSCLCFVVGCWQLTTEWIVALSWLVLSMLWWFFISRLSIQWYIVMCGISAHLVYENIYHKNSGRTTRLSEQWICILCCDLTNYIVNIIENVKDDYLMWERNWNSIFNMRCLWSFILQFRFTWLIENFNDHLI